ncbi:MAG: hypothetical protein HC803_08000 [Saprospiraceae bacterium]|nr:hypothetical protein [Saprospiraceae bacterium]
MIGFFIKIASFLERFAAFLRAKIRLTSSKKVSKIGVYNASTFSNNRIVFGGNIVVCFCIIIILNTNFIITDYNEYTNKIVLESPFPKNKKALST